MANSINYNKLALRKIRPLRRRGSTCYISLEDYQKQQDNCTEERVRALAERVEHWMTCLEQYQSKGGDWKTASKLLDMDRWSRWYRRADLLFWLIELTDECNEAYADCADEWPELIPLLDQWREGTRVRGSVPKWCWKELDVGGTVVCYHVGEYIESNLRLEGVYLSSLRSPHPNTLPYLSPSEFVNIVCGRDTPPGSITSYGSKIFYLIYPHSGVVRHARFTDNDSCAEKNET